MIAREILMFTILATAHGYMRAAGRAMQRRTVKYLRSSVTHTEITSVANIATRSNNRSRQGDSQDGIFVSTSSHASSHCDVSVAPFWDICSVLSPHLPAVISSHSLRGSQVDELSMDDAIRAFNGSSTEYLPEPRNILQPFDAVSKLYMSRVKANISKSLLEADPKTAVHLRIEEYGFGSMMHILLDDVLSLTDRNMGVILPNHLSRWSRKGNLSVFFDLPLSTASTGNETERFAHVLHDESKAARILPSSITQPRSNIGEGIQERTIDATVKGEAVADDYVTGSPSHRKDTFENLHTNESETYTRFLRVSAIASTLMVPRREILEQVEIFQQKVGWLPNMKVAGLHLRGSDSCRGRANRHFIEGKARDCDPIRAFVPDLERIKAIYGIEHVFVATDEAKKLMKEVQEFPQFQWFFSVDRRFYRGDAKKIHDPESVGKAYVRDLELLSRADVLVGKFTSNLERLALELRAGRNEALSPFISQDAVWCFGEKMMPVAKGRHRGETFECGR